MRVALSVCAVARDTGVGVSMRTVRVHRIQGLELVQLGLRIPMRNIRSLAVLRPSIGSGDAVDAVVDIWMVL